MKEPDKRLFIILASLVLASCINQPATQTLHPTSTLFSTPIPAIHHWAAGPVLAQLYQSAGYTEPENAWMVVPSVVIYADGRIIRAKNSWSTSNNVWSGTIRESRISLDEICSLLAKIEQAGFLDFNQADYVSPTILDDGSTDIIVNAWRSNSISAYAFEAATDRPAALVTTYNLLSSYMSTSPYIVERAELLVVERRVSRRPDDAYAWPATLPPLKKLIPNPGDSSRVVLTGQNMLDAYEFLGRVPYLSFIWDDGIEYQVVLRPLLPFELPKTREGWSPPSSFEETPKVDLTCDTRIK